jgi:hypothetical protein
MSTSDDNVHAAELQLHESVALLELLHDTIPAAHAHGLGASKFAFKVDIALQEALPKIKVALQMLDAPRTEKTERATARAEAEADETSKEIVGAPEHSLAALRERARKLGLQLLDHRDGVFSVHEKGYSEWRRDFDTLEEVDEWFRQSAPMHLIGGIQNALYGIRSIATIMVDQDETEHVAALDTIVRECNRALEGIDLLPIGAA